MAWQDNYGVPYKKEHDAIFYNHCASGKTPPEISFLMNIPLEKLTGWSKDPRYKSFGRAYEAGLIALEAHMISKLQNFKEANQAAATKTQLEELKRWFPDWNLPDKKEKIIIDPLKSATEAEINRKAQFALEKMQESKERLKPPILKVVENDDKSRKA